MKVRFWPKDERLAGSIRLMTSFDWTEGKVRF